MSDNPSDAMRSLIQQFLSGQDQSIHLVNRIEGLLIEEFADSRVFEELSPYLAMYRPGGGEHLYNETQLAEELRYVLSTYLGDRGDANRGQAATKT